MISNKISDHFYNGVQGDNRIYHEVDEFICPHCGLHLEDWIRYVYDDDFCEKHGQEYVFKYCPECGSKIRGEYTVILRKGYVYAPTGLHYFTYTDIDEGIEKLKDVVPCNCESCMEV